MVDNALKYNEEKNRIVRIAYTEEDKSHKFSVSNNGIGIEQNNQNMIFRLFTTIPTENRKPSTGIGLNTIKMLLVDWDEISV